MAGQVPQRDNYVAGVPAGSEALQGAGLLHAPFSVCVQRCRAHNTRHIEVYCCHSLHAWPVILFEADACHRCACPLAASTLQSKVQIRWT